MDPPTIQSKTNVNMLMFGIALGSIIMAIVMYSFLSMAKTRSDAAHKKDDDAPILGGPIGDRRNLSKADKLDK